VHSQISHSGIIESVAGDCVKVRILQTSACAACKVAAHCSASESKEKIVDVFNVRNTASLKVGDPVMVSASRDVAGRALLFAFGIPFMVLVTVLVVVLQLTGQEGLAALSGLGSLVPYYFLLWLLRKKIQRQIAFHIDN
jgi:sigma-E factor negative regulatory protein RseC